MSLLLLLSAPARAEIDPGAAGVWVSGSRGAVSAEAVGPGVLREHGHLPAAYLEGVEPLGFVVADPGCRPRGELWAFDSLVYWSGPRPADARRLAEQLGRGAVAGRVWIGGEAVGWRVSRWDGVHFEEAWLFTEAYAPVRPGPTVDPQSAFAAGWEAPYAEEVEVWPAPADEVAAELAAWAGAPRPGSRLAHTRFTPVRVGGDE